MQATVNSNRTCAIVPLSGRITMAEAGSLRASLTQRIAAGESWLVLDLGDVEFVDSSGLSVLITAMKRCRESGGDVVLARARNGVRKLLELTRLHRVMEVVDDLDAAVALCRRKSAD